MSRRESLGNSFSVQYTSVILILLTVTVGSFSARHREPQLPPPPAPRSERPTLATVPLPDLFSGTSSEPTENGLAALHELLSRHDIRARLVLPLETKNVQLSFHRFVSAKRAAMDLAIPDELLTVELDENIHGAPLLIIEPPSSS